MEEKILLETKPKFNFIYELFMPTGKKIKISLFIAIIFTLLVIFISTNSFGGGLISIGSSDINNTLSVVSVFAMIISYLLLIFRVILKVQQYNFISYKFYESYLVYEDSFLNQHTKKISYENVKEVELRRTIWDRLLGFGVIIIHTNAENGIANGLVVYAQKQADEKYKKIDEIIHKK